MDHAAREKSHICEIGRRIWLRGCCAGNEGNLSIRTGENRVLCTPTGRSKGFLAPEMMTTVGMNGERVDPSDRHRPSSEVKLHLAIYRHRPDVRAVVHAHPPHATAFALAGAPLPEGLHPEAEVFLGRVPTAPYATPGTRDLPDAVVPHIDADTNSVLLANHGVVCFSRDLTDAYQKLEILDAYCRVLLLARQLGGPVALSDRQRADLRSVRRKLDAADDDGPEPNAWERA